MYSNEIVAKVYVRMLQTVVHLWIIQLDELKSCGFNVHEEAIPVNHRVLILEKICVKLY